MTGFPINPPRAPLVDGKGNITSEWYRFFVQIQKEIGSGVSSPFEDTGFLFAAPSHARGEQDNLAPPSVPSPEFNDLTPPSHAATFDDLLYPPFYGV